MSTRFRAATERQHRSIQDRRIVRNPHDRGTRPRAGRRLSSTDARGVAEPANVATAAAIANAFYNATGKRIRTLPMSPANVLAALAEQEADSHAHIRVDRCALGRSGGGAAGRVGARQPVVAKAGGMDLLDLMKEGVITPARVVNLKSIAGLDGIRVDETDGLELGALVTLARIAAAPEIRGALPGARRRRSARVHASGSQRRDDRRQSSATAALLVFPKPPVPRPTRLIPATRPATATTSTTRSSTTGSRRWCTPRHPRRRSWPTAHASS